MGPKFSVFIFVLCLCALMVSQAQVPPPPTGLRDIKKSRKYRRSIENLQSPRRAPQEAHGKKFRENDVNIAEK